jgi:Tfp pilus assembly protein PilW
MKKARQGEKAFTMVELLIVMIMSLILIAGMVGLIEMSMKQFNNSRAVEAITDSSRRALSSMGRQIKTALHFEDASCDANNLTFYADIDDDNGTAADVNNYTNADLVQFYRSGTKLVQRTQAPVSEGSAVSFVNLCSDVSSVTFHYFAKGVKPVYSGGTYTNEVTSNYNAGVGMVKIIVTFQKGRVVRQFEQDVFLRILLRTD